MVRPIKPDSTHLPETAFEKPQGPHRLHVLKQDNVDKSNAFLRVGRKSQEDHDSSDTDFEEEDDDVTKMTADGIKMATEGSKMDAPGFKMVTEGSKMVTEGSKMVTEGSKIVTEESKMDVEGTKVVHNVVADTLNMATDGTTMTLNGFKMAAAEETTDDCSKMVAQGSKMADDCSTMIAQGSKMAENCSKMVTQGSKMASLGKSIFADESDDVTTVCRAPITSDMETTSAVVKSVLFDEVSVISQVTAQVGDVEKIYSELEKMTMERIRQEEEDRKFALQMQEMWEKDELQRARHVTSDYKLRRKEPVTAKRTATPKGTVPRQTTLDKHVQQVRS
ncbi:hypothetical protein LSTR_LSTR007978 [Laodelphax striatellus]|uniref:Uncharacterized protein n=1 Tax=Laodelphax striatellus TaxID=195883 RepID=A0A482WIH0_LAOST|nr:hypothetical protein LSTR_LSTR007978 [Laodelphax striatellus]